MTKDGEPIAESVNDETGERKPYYRDGVKVDFIKSNDYPDGYNAGRRWARKRAPLWALWWFAVGMATEAILRGVV